MKSFIRLAVCILAVLLCSMFQSCALIDFTNKKELTAEEVYELVAPSVVEISCESATLSKTGTGFFYDNKGTVVTNYHVIDGCTTAEIILTNGESYAVDKVLGFSIEKDIAILSTKCLSSIPLQIRTSAVKTGETVYAIGSSLGLTGSFSDGIISSTERNSEGVSYLQTTAPISQGNSGGPLVDKQGKVVGINTLYLADGQNLNFAVAISEINSVSVDNPITFGTLKNQEVEWIMNQDFFYYADEDSYVLVFGFGDENKVPMASSGTVDINILNNDGAVVYDKTVAFTESNFETWTYNEIEERYLATIRIYPYEISKGTTKYGAVYFTVEGNNYYFDESEITTVDLPIKNVQVELPNLPLMVNSYGVFGEKETTLRIDKITYEFLYEDSLYFYFTGEKIYDTYGNNSDTYSTFEWKLYDEDGYLIEKGSTYIDDLSVGDKFKDEIGYVFSGVKAGTNYRLVIVGAKESEKQPETEYAVGLRTITISDKYTAEYLVALWRYGEATESSMIEMMNENGADQGGGQLIVVQKGDFVEEIENWCFNKERKPGDVAIIENIYGYSICYFSSIIE